MFSISCYTLITFDLFLLSKGNVIATFFNSDTSFKMVSKHLDYNLIGRVFSRRFPKKMNTTLC